MENEREIPGTQRQRDSKGEWENESRLKGLLQECVFVLCLSYLVLFTHHAQHTSHHTQTYNITLHNTTYYYNIIHNIAQHTLNTLDLGLTVVVVVVVLCQTKARQRGAREEDDRGARGAGGEVGCSA